MEIACLRLAPRQGLSEEERGKIIIPYFKVEKNRRKSFKFTLTILSFLFDPADGGDAFRFDSFGVGDGGGGGGDGIAAAAASAARRSSLWAGKMEL